MYKKIILYIYIYNRISVDFDNTIYYLNLKYIKIFMTDRKDCCQLSFVY